MSRSDGKFPSYTKYKIHVDNWPAGYWDKSYRCSNCLTHWPQVPFFARSLCCDESCSTSTDPPDMRWPDAVLSLNEVRFEKLYDEWNEDKTDEDLFIEEAIEDIERIDTLTEHL